MPSRKPKARTKRTDTSHRDRRQDILDAALTLIADEGYAGASLRKLATVLGMQQPSLYHYFTSKDALVEQVVETFAAEMFSLHGVTLPRELEDVPGLIRDAVFQLYESSNHALFTRVLFGLPRAHPRFRELMREIFVDRTELMSRALISPFVMRGEVDEASGLHLVRMVTNAIGLRLMEEHVLFGELELRREVREFADFVVDAGRARLVQLKHQNRRTS